MTYYLVYFLRAMQKSKYCNAIRSDYDDKDLDESMKRFESIMKLLDKSLGQTVKNDDDDFSKAMESDFEIPEMSFFRYFLPLAIFFDFDDIRLDFLIDFSFM